jgi:hypothetical protein
VDQLREDLWQHLWILYPDFRLIAGRTSAESCNSGSQLPAKNNKELQYLPGGIKTGCNKSFYKWFILCHLAAKSERR